MYTPPNEGVAIFSCSSDLNLIKNRESVEEVESPFCPAQSQNITDLEKICVEELTKISATACANLLKTYKERLTSIMANLGYKVQSIKVLLLTKSFFVPSYKSILLRSYKVISWMEK